MAKNMVCLVLSFGSYYKSCTAHCTYVFIANFHLYFSFLCFFLVLCIYCDVIRTNALPSSEKSYKRANISAILLLSKNHSAMKCIKIVFVYKAVDLIVNANFSYSLWSESFFFLLWVVEVPAIIQICAFQFTG